MSIGQFKSALVQAKPRQHLPVEHNAMRCLLFAGKYMTPAASLVIPVYREQTPEQTTSRDP